MRKLVFRAIVIVALGIAAITLVGPRAVILVLAGFAIACVGIASFRSLAVGGVVNTPPTPVDPREERISYLCQECGAELLLLVRGTDLPPRHCGEKMHERREVARLN